jgi:predicted GNAT family acetyltransferase
MLSRCTFQDCEFLLRQLWPAQPVLPIDNTGGLIHWLGNEYQNIHARYYVWTADGEAVATVHTYNVSDLLLRIRGMYVREDRRGQQIGSRLLKAAVEPYSGMQWTVFGFCRAGTERFYARHGFQIREPMMYALGNPFGHRRMDMEV